MGNKSHLLLGNKERTPWVNKKYNEDFTKPLPDCDFNQEICWLIPFPTSTRPTQRISMEEYFVMEFSVCGGEFGPLSLSTDLDQRQLLGSRLQSCSRGTASTVLAELAGVHACICHNVSYPTSQSLWRHRFMRLPKLNKHFIGISSMQWSCSN